MLTLIIDLFYSGYLNACSSSESKRAHSRFKGTQHCQALITGAHIRPKARPLIIGLIIGHKPPEPFALQARQKGQDHTTHLAAA